MTAVGPSAAGRNDPGARLLGSWTLLVIASVILLFVFYRFASEVLEAQTSQVAGSWAWASCWQPSASTSSGVSGADRRPSRANRMTTFRIASAILGHAELRTLAEER